MIKKLLRGRLVAGFGDAKHWNIEHIRNATGRPDLKPGTLNIELKEPHVLRPDYVLSRESRSDGRDEDLHFEHCNLVLGTNVVAALIARTSRNYWGDNFLEIMADEILRSRYDLSDNDSVAIEVQVEDSDGRR